ncbi:MAG: hypothetical protein AAGF89_07255 [Bacteroidota bacterium]
MTIIIMKIDNWRTLATYRKTTDTQVGYKRRLAMTTSAENSEEVSLH